MSLIHHSSVPEAPQYVTAHNADTIFCHDTVSKICQLYPEIASWHPAQIADAWHKWCELKSQAPAVPQERDDAFPLYLVRLIRNRLGEMNEWR
ncbi:hypothetical protein OY10_004603 [Salmonella enterica subsp. enterica serovar Havana]|nr:hypothetical protein [Salmonella enterica subsp. enterica serovar Havana]EDV6712238.1 hypothetical protein [Salmonella enterica subsp. enterica serovar Havana]